MTHILRKVGTIFLTFSIGKYYTEKINVENNVNTKFMMPTKEEICSFPTILCREEKFSYFRTLFFDAV